VYKAAKTFIDSYEEIVAKQVADKTVVTDGPQRTPKWRDPDAPKLKNMSLSQVIANEQFRGLIDGEMDQNFRAYVMEKLKRDEERAYLEIIQLSIVTHILTQDVVAQVGDEAGGEKNLVPPVEGLV